MRLRHPLLLLCGLALVALATVLWYHWSPGQPAASTALNAPGSSAPPTAGVEGSAPAQPGRGTDGAVPSSARSGTPTAGLVPGAAGVAAAIPDAQIERHRPGERSASQGVPVSAQIQLADGTTQELLPNQIGVYPRVMIQPRERMPVTLRYPGAEAGNQVIVTVRQGGDLDGGKGVAIVPVAEDGTVQFGFTSGQAEGVYHVEARQGTDVKVLDFWVGTPHRLANE